MTTSATSGAPVRGDASAAPARGAAIRLSPVPCTDGMVRSAFERAYRAPRRPVVLRGLATGWPAHAKWSVEYLAQLAGDRRVPVYDSRPARGREHQHAPTARIRIADFVERLRAGERDLRIFFLRVVEELPELCADFTHPDLGLRFFDKLSVLFVGGRGSRVQMHFDIDRADILLCHFGGRKRVMLFAPEETPHLYRVPFSFSTLFDVDPATPDYERFPALRHARGAIAELAHGDALYIPPGYWHYVLYDEIGLSLSLRALPRTARDVLAALYNILVLRTTDGLMRKVVGQPWNERNERLAVRRTHARLGLA